MRQDNSDGKFHSSIGSPDSSKTPRAKTPKYPRREKYITRTLALISTSS
jgi:hypothetical protein